MISDVSLWERGAGLQTSDATRLPPWSVLTWGVFVPAVFMSNVVLAICAWFIVEWTMRLL
jgi:hypothetical protein